MGARRLAILLYWAQDEAQAYKIATSDDKSERAASCLNADALFVESYAQRLIEARSVYSNSHPIYLHVGDEFAAVADSGPKWKVVRETSLFGNRFFQCGNCYHAIAFDLAKEWIERDQGTLAKRVLGRYVVSQEESRQVMDTVTVDLIVKNWKWLQHHLTTLFVPKNLNKLVHLLDQEVCRAADRRLVTERECSIDATLSEIVTASPATLTHDEPRKRRPAYERDHLWLQWHEDDRLGPAKIRDRWNRLSDEKRQAICPTASERIVATDSKTMNAARALVKTAYRKAAKERGLESIPAIPGSLPG
jgi:hypothetical protein